MAEEEKITHYTPVQPAPPSQKQKQNNKLLVAVFIVAVVVLGTLTIFDVDLEDLNPREWFKETIPEEPDIPASVELYRFSDMNTNISVNIEIWVINIGETIAKDITVYIRARDQDGAIIYNGDVDLTALILRDNETCSGYYEIPITNMTTAIYHTIEINWVDGRTSYSKTSLL